MQIIKSLIPVVFLIIFSLPLLPVQHVMAQTDTDVNENILVKDFVWKSGGRGQSATLKEITLKNTGIREYTNIEIEIELYSRTDTPQGSLRSTIKDILPAGSEKTFYNIQFGVMHTDLENATARVVRAEEIEKGTPTHPRHLLLVKDWEFTGGRYGTEGILESITIENRSNFNFKDIKIKLSNFGVSGPKVGAEGYTSRVVIHDVIPAKSEKTFKNINVGFRHPDATRYNIYVMDAERISSKELRYLRAEKEGKPAKGKTKATVITESEQKSSLAERYKQKIAEQKEGDVPAEDISSGSREITQEPTAEPASSDMASDEKRTPEEEQPDTTSVKAKDTDTTDTTEQDTDFEEEEEVPLPKHDIVVKSFRMKSGVPGTVGVLENLTLENISGINYTKIHLIVEFYSPNGVPLGSNDLRVYEVLPAGETRTFEDLKIGIIQLAPDNRNMKIRVKDASVMKR